MINKIKNSLQNVGVILSEQASNLSGSAKEKGYGFIEDWVTSLKRFEELGFEITSFGVGASITPSAEVEMVASHTTFPPERIDKIIEIEKITTPISLVFSTIRTTYNLHKTAGCKLEEPLIVKIKVKLSPEINVILGMPKIV